MRLDQKDDKKLQSNLRTLLLCSQFRTIQLSNSTSKFQKAQRDMLEDPENQDLVDFLTRAFEEKNRMQNSDAYLVNPTIHDLINVELPDNTYIPKSLQSRIRTHQYRVGKLEEFSKARDEHEELRDLLYGDSKSGRISYKNIDLRAVRNFLRDKSHTERFQKFGNAMLTENQAITLFKYRNYAKHLGKTEDISDQFFVDRVNQTFSTNTVELGLNKEMKGRFTPAFAKVTAVALTALLAINGAANIFHHDKNVSEATTDPHYAITDDSFGQIHDEELDDALEDYGMTSPDGAIIPLVNETTITPPISNSIKVDSYESAAKDLFQKVEEIYKYNTGGQEVSLGDLKYENIGQAGTSVLLVNYNGQEYRFSTMSDMRTNRSNLERALTAAGATFTSYDTSISYLTRDGKSIAIVDSQGNPVQSGKVLETSYGGGTEMYNQSWVNAAKRMMSDKGISSDGKSEAELVGYYLLNSTPQQNPELSRALGVVSPLVSYMKGTFYYRDGNKSDPYTVQQYVAKSHKIAESFNNAALGIEPDVQTLEDDGR